MTDKAGYSLKNQSLKSSIHVFKIIFKSTATIIQDSKVVWGAGGRLLTYAD